MTQRHQQPHAHHIGAPTHRIILAILIEPPLHQRFGGGPGKLAVWLAAQIAQPLPAVHPILPGRGWGVVARAGAAKINVAQHRGVAGMDQPPGEDAFAILQIAGHRINRHPQQLERKAAAQAQIVQWRGIKPAGQPGDQLFTQRKPALPA